MNNESPVLCEPGVKYFINCSLRETNRIKEKRFNFFFNIIMTLFFLLILFGILFYKYKGKMSVEEKQKKQKKKQEYIISKLQYLSAIRDKNNLNIISNLPTIENNPELEMLKRYV